MVAELLEQWLRCVIQAAEPWLSSEGIERGSVWFTEISSKLSDTSVGIICLTEDNKNKPWILFEAGAISKGLTSNRVCTFLIDLSHQDIENPLAQFNHTEPTRDGLWNLVLTINGSMGDRSLSDSILRQVYDTYWPKFEQSFADIMGRTPAPKEPKKRKEGEVLSEVLEAVRSMDRRMYRLEEPGASKRLSFENRRPALKAAEARLLLDELVAQGLPEGAILDKLVSQGVPEDWAIRRLREVRSNGSHFTDGPLNSPDGTR